MKAMKKSVAILLAVCMIVPMFVLAAFTASANEDPWSTGTVEDPTGTAPPQEQQTTTITVGVITYLTEELESSGWQVHYWGGADGAADSDLTATGETKQKKLGSDYWGDEAQTFNIYTAEIPADATGFKVHNGDRWFGEDGSLDKPVAFVFNYSEYDGDPNADRAVYECEDGFYIVGSFNTWAVQKSYKLEQKDPDDDSVFVLKNFTLKKNAELKVVSFSMFDGITWYVQTVMNRLYERRSATEADVNVVIDELLIEKNWEYAALLRSLPDGAARLMKAIAREGVAKAVTSGKFIAAHSLRAASSVSLSLRKLLEDELLYETDEGYVVYDRLFGFWLARLPKS